MAEQTEKPLVIKAPWYSHWKPFLMGMALGGAGIGGAVKHEPMPPPAPVVVEKKCPVCVKEICKDVNVNIIYTGPVVPGIKINDKAAK